MHEIKTMNKIFLRPLDFDKYIYNSKRKLKSIEISKSCVCNGIQTTSFTASKEFQKKGSFTYHVASLLGISCNQYLEKYIYKVISIICKW